MNKTNINYPHPVLSSGNEDYINSEFDIELVGDAIIEGSKAIIEVSYTLKCDGLQKLIEDGKAKVVVYLESVVAEYRDMKTFNAGENVLTIDIDKERISRSLVLKGYIISATEIQSFVLPEHNKEIFGTIPFNLRKGDLLGIATHSFTIPLETYDPLADRPSIFSIRLQTDRPKEEISADFSGNKIIIWLNEETHDKYKKLYEAPDVRGVLASFFAAPVLVDALTFMKYLNDEERASYEDKKWYQVISHRLKTLNLDLLEEASLTKVANQILPHIFPTSVDSLTQLCTALLKGGDQDEN